jgi:rubrerythrin
MSGFTDSRWAYNGHGSRLEVSSFPKFLQRAFAMATARSSQDVFEMAIQMEQVGKNFYAALALGSDDPKVRVLCAKLAKDEEAHLIVFQNLRKQWEKITPAAPATGEKAYALAELVKAQVQPDTQEVTKVAMGGNLADALNMAIQMEKDAINFYQGLIANLPDSASAIQTIVDQERNHLVRLKSMA